MAFGDFLNGLGSTLSGTRTGVAGQTRGLDSGGVYHFQNDDNTWGSANLQGNNNAQSYFDNETAYDNGDMQYSKTDGGMGGGLGGYLSTGSKILEGAGAIMAARNAKKELALAREKFGFEKAATNRNAVNQGKAYNEELGRRADVGLALGGNAITDTQRASTLGKIAGQRVSESAIG